MEMLCSVLVVFDTKGHRLMSGSDQMPRTSSCDELLLHNRTAYSFVSVTFIRVWTGHGCVCLSPIGVEIHNKVPYSGVAVVWLGQYASVRVETRSNS